MEKNESTKNNLNQFVDDYTDLLLQQLVSVKIIEVVANQENSNTTSFQLIQKSAENIQSNEVVHRQSNIVQSFYDFRNIISLVYRELKFKAVDETGRGVTLSHIIQKFVNLQIFEQSWENYNRLKVFLDQADNFFSDEDIKADAIGLLEKNKINFLALILKVIKFYTNEILVKAFPGARITTPVSMKITYGSDFKVLNAIKNVELFVQVKFRKAKYSIKEYIVQCIEVLKDYSSNSDYKTNVLLIVFSYDDLSGLQRSQYKFIQNMEENYPDFLEAIHFIPVSINAMEQLGPDLLKMRDKILNNIAHYFTFQNQPVKMEQPDMDDHYYPKILNIKEYNYVITFKPVIEIEHWRFGIKFSRLSDFPTSTFRYFVGFPLLHVTKNKSSEKLLITFYNDAGQFGLETPTLMDNYASDPLVIKLFTENGEVTFDIMRENGKSIVQSPIKVGSYPYGQLFAWADNRNPFLFETKIMELDK